MNASCRCKIYLTCSRHMQIVGTLFVSIVCLTSRHTYRRAWASQFLCKRRRHIIFRLLFSVNTESVAKRWYNWCRWHWLINRITINGVDVASKSRLLVLMFSHFGDLQGRNFTSVILKSNNIGTLQKWCGWINRSAGIKRQPCFNAILKPEKTKYLKTVTSFTLPFNNSVKARLYLKY